MRTGVQLLLLTCQVLNMHSSLMGSLSDYPG